MSSDTDQRTPEELEMLRAIPSVESLLSSAEGKRLSDRYGRPRLLTAVRTELAGFRSDPRPFDEPSFFERVVTALATESAPSLHPLINATGVLIHTNLGRAPIAPEIWARAEPIISGYSNLELDDERGSRGSRQSHIRAVCRELFGVESALLVNNNAAAVMLVLAAIAEGKEVVVSRGELVEIGGSFRIPDVIERGGAILREVGTTNRTRIDDYASAIGPRTGALLSVHQSNFRIVGFSERPSDRELSTLSSAEGVPLVVDEGAGRVVPLEKWGLEPAPTLRELASIAGIVTCSTDKLIGASQGGLILGSEELIERCGRHPLMRALRPGKESFALVAATLDSFVRDAHETEIPLYTMLSARVEELRARGRRILESSGVSGTLIESRAKLGGGTTPEETVPSLAVALDGPAELIKSQLLAGGVVARIEDDVCLVDLRTVPDTAEQPLSGALQRIEAAIG